MKIEYNTHYNSFCISFKRVLDHRMLYFFFNFFNFLLKINSEIQNANAYKLRGEENNSCRNITLPSSNIPCEIFCSIISFQL